MFFILSALLKSIISMDYFDKWEKKLSFRKKKGQLAARYNQKRYSSKLGKELAEK